MSEAKIQKNLGTLDRIIRLFLALVVIALYGAGFIEISNGNFLSGAIFWAAAIMGGIFLVTSALGFCPVYALLRISTCDKQEVV